MAKKETNLIQSPVEPETIKPVEPVEPIKDPPVEPVKPVEPVEPVKDPSVEPVKTQIATVESLLANDSTEKLEPDADFVSSESLLDDKPNVNTSQNDSLGCQCYKCKQSPSKDKRGRHHKSCPCKTCNPAPSFADITPEAAATNYQLLAETTFDLSTGILTMVFGDEWKARSPDERNSVVMPLKIYLESKQAKDIPPGLMLTIVAVAYAAPRFAAPTTKQKLSLAWAWVKSKFKRKKALSV